MMYKIFTVYDMKAEVYSPPMFMRSRGEFMRSFGETCNDQSTTIGRHPEDFCAFEIGVWDDSQGRFESHVVPESVGKAVDFVYIDEDAVRKIQEIGR